MSPRGRVYGRSSEPVDSLHVLEQYARFWSQSATLQKGVLFSGNTEQETTGINNAFNSPAQVIIFRSSGRQKQVCTFFFFFLMPSCGKPQDVCR